MPVQPVEAVHVDLHSVIYINIYINILKDKVGGLHPPTLFFFFPSYSHLKLQECLLSEAWKSLDLYHLFRKTREKSEVSLSV